MDNEDDVNFDMTQDDQSDSSSSMIASALGQTATEVATTAISVEGANLIHHMLGQTAPATRTVVVKSSSMSNTTKWLLIGGAVILVILLVKK